MSSYRVPSGDIDTKREEFRGYLEKNGLLQYIVEALSQLYNSPERPDDPYRSFLELLQSQRSLTTLGPAWEQQGELEETKRECAHWKSKYEQLHLHMMNSGRGNMVSTPTTTSTSGSSEQSQQPRPAGNGDGNGSIREVMEDATSSSSETDPLPPLTSTPQA